MSRAIARREAQGDMDISTLSGTSTLKSALPVYAKTAAAGEAAALDESSVQSTLRALDAFRSELQSNLKARFFSKFAPPEPNFSRFSAPADAQSVADEALATAKELSKDTPLRAAKSLISFRANVRETAEYVRATLGSRPDIGDIGDVVSLLNKGVDRLEADNANRLESTASILSAKTRSKEKSTILIRTQEGDNVAITLRNNTSVRIRDEAASTQGVSSSETSIKSVEERSIKFRVEGDLNAEEQAAIEAVVGRAAEIAEDFFGGDLAAAFDNAEAFDFDTTQLRRVNLRFRLDQTTRVSYAEQSTFTDALASLSPAPTPSAPAAPAVPKPTVDLEPIILRPAKVPEASADIDPFKVPEPSTDSEAATEATSDPVAQPPSVEAAQRDALAGLFEVISNFLRTTADGFTTDGQTQLVFSERFKLTLLRETLVTAAPAEQQPSADNAAEVIDKVAETL
ncbi:MAG: hypothetical protein AAGA84_00820 [Pseudomonadota bacterium]